MRLGLNLGLSAKASGSGGAADPYASLLALFASSEAGEVWIAHPDYFFTDTACTTPVSAVGDEVQGWLGAKYGVKFTSSTAGRIPKYARQPVGGWTQQLLYTETLSNALWTKTAVILTSGQADPDGGTSAWRITSNTTGNVSNMAQVCQRGNGAHTYSWIAKAGNVNRMLIGIYKTGSYSDNIADLTTDTWALLDAQVTGAITDLGSGWKQVSITYTGAMAEFAQPVHYVGPINSAGTAYNSTTNGNYIDIYHPMRNAGSSPATYERRDGLTDAPVTGDSVAALWFDGDSDGMSTPAVNLTGTNEATIWWGWDKHAKINNFGVIVESSADLNFNDGVFRVAETGGNVGSASDYNYYFSAKGNALFSRYLTEEMAPRHRAVGCLAIDLSAGASSMSATVKDGNGTYTALTTDSGTTTGTGNFGNHTLHIGTRGGGTGLDACGYMVGALVVLGRAPAGSEVTDIITTIEGLA